MPDGNEVTFKSPTTGKVQAVPPEHWDEALKQGYTSVSHVVMYDQSGKRGMVPKEQAGQYRDKGYKITAPGSETQFERERSGGGGVWGALKGMLPSDPTEGRPLTDPKAWLNLGFDPKGPGSAYSTLTRPLPKDLPTNVLSENPNGNNSMLGRGMYRGASLFGPLAGVSAENMEEASGRADTAGVATQAAVPAALAVGGPLLGKAMGAARPALQRAVYKELPTGGAPQLTKGARFASGIVGGGTGGLLGHASGVPGAGYMGGHVGLLAGPSALETIAGTPELGDIRNPGPFGKIPMRAPPPVEPPPRGQFLGMTSSEKPLGSATLPEASAKTSVLGNQPSVQMVEKFGPPARGKILGPDTPPPDYKVTYQSVPQAELRGKVMAGDIDAIREWQRRGLDLPENVGFMIESGAAARPWRAYKR